MTVSTFDEYCKKRGVTIRTTKRELSADERGWQHHTMKCMIAYKGRKLATTFKQGMAHESAPTAGDVLTCMFSDARSFADHGNFEEWAREYGYNSDSRKAESIYNACRETRAQLVAVFKGDYGAFEAAASENES